MFNEKKYKVHKLNAKGDILMYKFPKNVYDKLKYYVYVYIDPRDNQVFYIGKGKGNRAFSHLYDNSESEKVARIKEVKSENKEPIIEILIHGIESDEVIKKIEASIIDMIGINKLTNIQRGYESKEYGRMSIDQIFALYNSEKTEIIDPVMLIKINKTFRYGISDVELYDATRSAWVVGENREKAKYALSVYGNIVQEVYEIKGWFPNNSTFNTRKNEPADILEERWEFVGRIADREIRDRYRFKDVSGYLGTQNPIRYVNI